MVPSKWRLVNLGEGHAPTLVWIRDMSLAVVVSSGKLKNFDLANYIDSRYISVSGITHAPE